MSATAALVWSVGALVIIWGAFPLGLMIASAFRRRRRDHDFGDAVGSAALPPNVTVIIATREPAAVVRKRVVDALASDYPAESLDVVVTVDHQHPGLVDEIGALPARARVVIGDAPGGKAAALNAGVRAATGDVLVFTDSYQEFAPNAVRRVAVAAVADDVGAASGNLALENVSPRSPIGMYWRYEVWLRMLEAQVASVVGVFGPFWAMRRALWVPLPAGLILDDVYTPMRLVLGGKRVTIVPSALATELRNPTPTQEYRRKVRTLTGVLQLCAWLPGVLVPWRNPVWLQFVFHKLLRLLTAYLVLFAVVAAGVIAVRSLPGSAWMFLLGAGLVALIVTAARPRIGRRLGGAIASIVTLQAAVVVAAYNGLRGRWNVWHR